MQLWSSTASGKMTTFGQWCILLQKRSVGELLVLSVGRSVSFHLQVYLPWFLDKHDYLYLLSSKVLTVIVVHLLSKGRTGQKLYLIFLCRVESSSFFNFLHANFLSNFLTTMKLEKREKNILYSFVKVTYFWKMYPDLQYRTLQEDSTDCCCTDRNVF